MQFITTPFQSTSVHITDCSVVIQAIGLKMGLQLMDSAGKPRNRFSMMVIDKWWLSL